MRVTSRRDFLRMALGGFGAAVAAAHGAHASEANERLLVSVMALKRGDLIADDAATFTPFHRYKEQVLTLDVEDQRVKGTLLIAVVDKAAGGVQVLTSRIGADGEHFDRREFTMYPLGNTAATRQEMVLIPVVHVADDGVEERGVSTPIDLVITMKRALRSR
jgi:hypothetical protein